MAVLLSTTAPHAIFSFFFFQAEDGIRDHCVTGVQTCALPISLPRFAQQPCPWPAWLLCEAWQRSVKKVMAFTSARSEERRVGKECRSRWSPDHEKKKKKMIGGRDRSRRDQLYEIWRTRRQAIA